VAYAENFSRGVKFYHNLCDVTLVQYDVTNQLQGKCQRHDHSRGVRGMPPGKFCKITPRKTHFCAFWKQVLDNTVFTFLFLGSEGVAIAQWPPPSVR